MTFARFQQWIAKHFGDACAYGELAVVEIAGTFRDYWGES